MGQNGSTLANSGNDVSSPRRNTTRPKTPDYVIPENRVIPDGVEDMENARRLLRPVSQELAKTNPDLASICHSDPEMEFLAGDDSSLERSLNSRTSSDKENSRTGLTRSLTTVSGSSRDKNYSPEPYTSFATSKMFNNQPLSQSMDNGLDRNMKESNLKRTHSFEKNKSDNAKMLGHKRQASLSNVTPAKQPIILEDPREHLYNINRIEPFSNLMPGTTSLPVESSFDADIKMNLTYAQLAEHRRQQRLREYENLKSRRLKELGAEISATSTVPKSPFDRENLGAKSATLSVSTGSSDNGASKSKKTRAPPPPPGAVAGEPPIDYDMDDRPLSQSVQRRNSSASRNLRQPAPNPYSGSTKRFSVPTLNSVQRDYLASKNTSTNFKQNVSSTQLEPVLASPPPPPSAPPLPPFFQPTQASVSKISSSLESSNISINANTPRALETPRKNDSISEARKQIEMLKQMQAKLKADMSKPVEKDKTIDTNESLDEKSTKANDIKGSSVESKNSPRLKRMNSLLQHDIILAAQAQATKQRKPRQPVVLDKPKDAQQVFREELIKAATAREERRKEAIENGDNISSESHSTKGSDELSENKDLETTDIEIIKTLQTIDSIENGDNNDIGIKSHQQSPAQADEMSVSSNNSQRVYSSAWTPEDDLEPDDEIKDEGVEVGRRAESEGFKSSMIPLQIKNWKETNEKKPQKNKVERKEAAAMTKDKDKFGSIRRLKNTVRDSMKNVFVSVGKQTSKTKKNRKSQDFLDLSDPNPKHGVSPRHVNLDPSDNWELTRDGQPAALMRRSKSDNFLDRAPMRIVPIEPDSDDSDSDVGDIDFASGLNELMVDDENHDMADAKDEHDVKQMKRAGVAYVSGKGQIIVLPEYNRVNVDSEGNDLDEDTEDVNRAPRIFKKKEKKLKYESTMRAQERSRREEMIASEIRDKEGKIERERLRQQEIERDYRRLRDLDTQEKLQQIQTQSILEQISRMQQQQMSEARAQLSNGSMDPPPPIHTTMPLVNQTPVPQSYNPLPGTFTGQGSYSNSPAFTNIFLNQPGPQRPTMSPSINPTQFTTHSAPIIGNAQMSTANVPNLSTQELGYLSDYMRMSGVPPPSTQQQWAVLLSSISFNTSGFHGLNSGIHLANPSGTNGPDLSTLFGVNKTLENTIASPGPTSNSTIPTDNLQNLNKNVQFSNLPPSTRLVELDSNSLENSVEIQIQNESSANSISNIESSHENTADNTTPVKNGDENQSENAKENTVESVDTSTKEESVKQVETPEAPAVEDSPETRLDSLTSTPELQPQTAASDINGNQNDTNNEAQSESSAKEKNPGSTFSPFSTRLPPKVYGPIGFRPVSFRAGAS